MNEILKMEISFDYFSATFPLECHKDDNEMFMVHETVKMLANFFNIKQDLILRNPLATNRYRYQYTLGESITLRLAGPENDTGFKTCQLELKGDGCKEFERRNPEKTWLNLFTFLNILNAKPTRIDIATDDYSKQITLDWILTKVTQRFYISTILSKPKPIGTLDTGMSITFGNKNSPLELCIYDKLFEQTEKGKQLQEEFWTRYELRLRGEKAKVVYAELYKEFLKNSNNQDLTLKKITLSLLYKTLDIKVDNKYSIPNQKKAKTDPLWLKFLDNATKLTIVPTNKKSLSFESYFIRHEKSTVDFLLFHYLMVNKEIEAFEIELYKLLYRNTIHDKDRFHRLNLYLDQLNLKTLNDSEIENLRKEFFGIISEKELPF